jgi:HD-GYP domain-containing protein (c-di-GMP phosphodiesterase class II)
LKQALIIPFYHHERWDGSGYPHKLKGEEIPLIARLFAVVDVWDALSSDRPYRKSMRPEDVIAYLQREAGRLFDPDIVQRFIQLLSNQH